MTAPIARSRRSLLAVAALAMLLAVAAPAPALGHTLLWTVSQVPSEHPPTPEFLEDPCGLAVDPGGSVYLSDYYHDRVEAFGPSGSFIARYKGTEPLDGPCGMAFDPAGDLYANVYHRGVLRYPVGEYAAASGTLIAGAGLDAAHPTGVAVDQATGSLYVDDRTYIAAYEAPVHPGEVPLKIGEGTLQDGYGLAVSGFAATEGDLYVADAADNTVKVYDPTAEHPDEPIASIDGHDTPQGAFTSLTDAALAVDDSNGHLYVLDDLQPRFYESPEAALEEFDAAGTYLGQLPRLPLLVDGGPSGVAVDNTASATQGRVYVTSGNDQKSSLFAYGPGAAAPASPEFAPAPPQAPLVPATLPPTGPAAASAAATGSTSTAGRPAPQHRSGRHRHRRHRGSALDAKSDAR